MRVDLIGACFDSERTALVQDNQKESPAQATAKHYTGAIAFEYRQRGMLYQHLIEVPSASCLSHPYHTRLLGSAPEAQLTHV